MKLKFGRILTKLVCLPGTILPSFHLLLNRPIWGVETEPSEQGSNQCWRINSGHSKHPTRLSLLHWTIGITWCVVIWSQLTGYRQLKQSPQTFLSNLPLQSTSIRWCNLSTGCSKPSNFSDTNSASLACYENVFKMSRKLNLEVSVAMQLSAPWKLRCFCLALRMQNLGSSKKVTLVQLIWKLTSEYIMQQGNQSWVFCPAQTSKQEPKICTYNIHHENTEHGIFLRSLVRILIQQENSSELSFTNLLHWIQALTPLHTENLLCTYLAHPNLWEVSIGQQWLWRCPDDGNFPDSRSIAGQDHAATANQTHPWNKTEERRWKWNYQDTSTAYRPHCIVLSDTILIGHRQKKWPDTDHKMSFVRLLIWALHMDN